jgi:hypothetical protein
MSTARLRSGLLLLFVSCVDWGGVEAEYCLEHPGTCDSAERLSRRRPGGRRRDRGRLSR